MQHQLNVGGKIEKAVDAVIGEAIADRKIVGAVVLVSRSGEPVYRKAAGLADREAGTAMREDTIFRFASVTKPVVATATLALMERGTISLEDDVTRFLPNCKIPTLVLIGTADAGGTEHSRLMLETSPDLGKTMEWIKGGTHFMRGQEDKQAEAADYIAAWAKARNLG